MVLDPGGGSVDRAEGEGVAGDGRETLEPDQKPDRTKTRTRTRTSSINKRETMSHNGPRSNPWADPDCRGPAGAESAGAGPTRAGPVWAGPAGAGTRAGLRRPLSLEVKPTRWGGAEPEQKRVQQPPWRSGCAPSPPTRSLTSPGFMRRSESICAMNGGVGCAGSRGRMRPATSLPHIARVGRATSLASPSATMPRGSCLLVALRPINMEQERHTFFQSDFQYEPQFKYTSPQPSAVLDKYREGSDLFLTQGANNSGGHCMKFCMSDPRTSGLLQAVGIMECVLRKFGSYESFEEATGGMLLPKSRVWSAARKYLHKEGCVGEVVVCLSEELLSQAVMMVESCRPTLTINLSGARQHWLEGMLRHEIGTHYLRGVNNSFQPWSSAVGRKNFGLKPANPTEEGLASLHSVLLRKQPYLWRAALLYYTVYHAAHMSFSQLFSHIARFVKDPAVRWEYCIRAKRGQTDTFQPGCFSKDQVYLDGILRILRHRRDIDFKMLASLGKVSYEDVERLRHLAVLHKTRIPHFMQDQERYLQHLDHIVTVNELDDSQLRALIP